ncbi:MAG: TIGR00730 family Rossman fold protein [Pseudomonadota bacterium]
MPEPFSLCVFCGASSAVDQTHLQLAQEVGRTAAKRGMTIVFGGGRVGLMGHMADSALDHGGHVVGIIPQHLEDWEVGHQGTSEYHVVDSMHTRKKMMFDRSDAFCVLPGGLGTLDETFEMITWKQLKLHSKPIILLNYNNYWDPLLMLIDHQVRNGYMHGSVEQLVTIAESCDQVFDLLSTKVKENRLGASVLT